MEAKLYRATDGRIISCRPFGSKTFSLEDLQRFVNGKSLTFTRLPSGRILVSNRDGRANGHPVNFEVTAMAVKQGAIKEGDFFVGDILVCDHDLVDLVDLRNVGSP